MVSGLFLGTSLVLIASPGPDSVLATQLVLRTGRRGPAAVAALGMLSAGAIHAVLALTGVSLLLSAEPALFTAIQWGGAALLFLWGVLALRGALRPRPGAAAASGSAAPASATSVSPMSESAGRCFARGLLTTGSNPNVGLFLLAYLPQFVPEGAPLTRSMALLAAVHLSLAALWLGCLIVVVHLLRTWAAGRSRPGGSGAPARLVEALIGLVFIAFAARLALGW
ncbi:LysE family translocator [Streptomyces sp. NPDC053048]|uniref:LysE family translocator n=1 Tax=Streptomyces sp. NPDC053048 TaxID=3365694 RepID=UPI0037D5D5E9